jgi:outer membrane protein OmpA-like peptidoglycan-associated protein
MTRHCARAIAVAAFALLVAACQTGTVVLLPEKDGKDTAVVVKQRDGEVTLREPYAAATFSNTGPRAYQSSKDDVAAQFGRALDARPERPAEFTLYFVEGKDELTDESRQIVTTVYAEIAKRPVPDVLVVGHTDTVGSDQVNDPLSRKRAEIVRAGLIQSGIAPENIVAIGRGKRELAEKTDDGVANPRNRRVVIFVR